MAQTTVKETEEIGPPCQLVLETQAAPALLRRVGERQSGRVCPASVDAFLTRHHLRFDRDLLESMFNEADYRREGSLAPKDLLAAVAGRYPKRRHTQDWRCLAALLLGVPSLRLLDVDREPVTEQELAVHRKHAVFAYSAWPDVEDLPPAPKNTRRRPTARLAGDPSSQQGTAEWRAVLAHAEAAMGEGRPASADKNGSPLVLRTSRGVLAVGGGVEGARSCPEADINASLGLEGLGAAAGCATAAWQQQGSGSSGRKVAAAASDEGVPCFTFAAAERFAGNVEKTLLASALRTEAAAVGGAQPPPPQRQSFGEWLGGSSSGGRPAGSLGSRVTKTPAGATLLPRATALNASALARLRAAVKSEAERRPPFLLDFHPLLPGDEDRSRSLGLPLDTRRLL